MCVCAVSCSQKVEKLKFVCAELEAHIDDLEALIEHYEKKEAEFNKIR